MEKVKKRRLRGRTRISSKNQITLSAEALRNAGLRPGDELRVDADGRGRIVLTQEEDPISRFAGDLTGVYEPGYLDQLRAEWR